MAENNTQSVKLAFVLDGEVVEILHTDDRLSAIFRSNPLVIDITEKMSNPETNIWLGASYDQETDTFKNPVQIEDPYADEVTQ